MCIYNYMLIIHHQAAAVQPRPFPVVPPPTPAATTVKLGCRASELKDAGNKAFQAGEFQKAIDNFGEAIALDSSNHVLFSNRSAAFASLKNYQAAHADATKTVLQFSLRFPTSMPSW